MNNPTVSNPKDLQVVSFHNSTDFGFTPEMGCMYDGRAIHGPSGFTGINAGETMTLPYHVGHRLAVNLAKAVMIRSTSDKQQLDAQGQPMIKAIWNDVTLESLKNSFIKDLYTEDRPIAQSQTDLLMAKVEEYKGMVDKLLNKDVQPTVDPATTSSTADVKVYQDKQEVLAELEKRGIKHDKRSTKSALEKLLA